MILLFERIAPKPHWLEGDKLPLSKAFQIGCCQVLSIIPGVSRSGATILGAEMLGVDRRAATLFTFYLAVPTMLGASILELHHKAGTLSQGQGLNIAIGFAVSFVVAFFVIRQFLAIVTRYGLRPFGWYRIAAGIALIGYLAIH
jgi:undecaprenyl-diphosphatase